MKKKVIIPLVTILLINMTIITFATSITDLQTEHGEVQTNIKEVQEELEGVQTQKNESLSKIEELSNQIIESEVKLEELNTQVEQLEENLRQKEQSLKESEERYNSQQIALEDRLIAQYKTGTTTYLDVLLKSKSLSDFISKYYMVGQIAKMDQQLLDDIREEKEKIEKDKEELDRQKINIKTMKATQEKENVKLRNAKALKNSQVARLSEQEQVLQNQIDEYDLKMKELEQQIILAQKANSSNGTYVFNYTGGKFEWPVPSSHKISSIYGMRIHPIYGVPKMHNGIDIAGADWGAPFVAAEDGVVIKASDSGDGYGQCVVIDHGNGVSTLYAHGSAIYVKVGQIVKRGENVLAIGSSGVSTGKHAHFEVRVNGTEDI